MAKYNEKQKQWSAEYNKKAYDSLMIRVPKGDKEKYKALAERKGKSLNGLVVELLMAEMEK